VPVLEARHDFAHAVEGDSAWSESYYFNAYDPETDVGFFTRVGVRPNEGTLDAGMSVWLPGDRIALVHAVREQTEMVDDDLGAGGVRYERLEPMRSWRLTTEADAQVLDLATSTVQPGRLTLDAVFESLTPAIGTDGQGRTASEGSSAATGTMVGKGHLEQAGRWSGSVSCDGERWSLSPSSARGNRDKSWGPRRWGGPQMWRWFSINIGDDVHFGGIRIGTAAGDLHRGWVWRDGEATSIADWDVRSELADDGVTHWATHVKATDKAGRVHELDAEILRIYGVPHRTGERRTIVNEGLARWHYEGRVGYGISEYLHQLDDDGQPLVPIA
jgi:hypothetical protein